MPLPVTARLLLLRALSASVAAPSNRIECRFIEFTEFLRADDTVACCVVDCQVAGEEG
jgi:hypothetical protein